MSQTTSLPLRITAGKLSNEAGRRWRRRRRSRRSLAPARCSSALAPPGARPPWRPRRRGQDFRELGAEPAFSAIVAAGANGAQPHAEPGEDVIAAGELVVWDMGAQVDGYSSDCTRTFATGELDAEAAEVYELVRVAQAAALEAIRAGLAGTDADEVARAIIRDAGREELFGHGLGHGVGLEVHEAPRMGTTSEDELLDCDVVSVEPGVYVPGRFGVRIEDLVVVTADGHRNLTTLPKELRVVG